MEEQWVADRSQLRELLQRHPDWTNNAYAKNIGRSVGWVKVWKKRFKEGGFDDDTLLSSRSRARHNPPECIQQQIVEAILEIRDNPPHGLRRVPGPRTIIYFLQQDQALKTSGYHLPTSSATVWRILDQHQRIIRPEKVRHEPLERPKPMEEWQVDFKDVTTASSDPSQKKAHDIQTFDVIDAGTSMLMANPARADFNAVTVIQTLVEIFQQLGCPQKLRFDRDTRFVGSASGRDFPSAFVRFLLCLGIEPIICPPQRPDKNPFVERYHRTYEYECLRVDYPANLEAVNEVNRVFKHHYNHIRPHQGNACGNLPPCIAFPVLPELPSLPEYINPNRWLDSIIGRYYKRKITADGRFQIGRQSYYVSKADAGKSVVVTIRPKSHLLDVIHGRDILRSLRLKGLHDHTLMPLGEYISLISQEAYSEYQELLGKKIWRMARM